MAGYSLVNSVAFSLAGDEEVKQASLAEITSYEIHDSTGAPAPNGVGDLRMGTTDHAMKCLTCVRGKRDCEGHRGHINIRAGVPQPIGGGEIRRWLRVACLTCGAIVVEREKYASITRDLRLATAAQVATEGRRCGRCGAIHPKIVKDDEDHFTYRIKAPGDTARGRAKKTDTDKGEKLPADTIKAIFERISDADCLDLGRSLEVHPRKLIMRCVPVAPNTIRPGVKNFGGSGSSYNDSTSLIQNLVKRNDKLPEQLPETLGPNGGPSMLHPDAAPVRQARPVPAPDDLPKPRRRGRGAGDDDEENIERSVSNLQQIYYDLVMGSSSTSATQGNSGKRGLVMGSRPVRSYLRNLPRKDGRIRANLLGKRVFYISRSTISGNMSYRIDEVGVPLEFARTLQVAETVQEYNREFLMPFFLNGHRQYPGCTQILRRQTGKLHDVTGRGDFTLENGDVLYRDVINGDIAYFNRQPSLERSNIGVHRVIVIQDPSIRTLQMNVLACEGYGADFDGDQMNLWVVRGPAARAEALIMSGIANWFISTKSGGPLNGQVQDSILGCYELTRSVTKIDKYHMMGLFAAIEPPRLDGYARDHVFSGREAISFALERTPIDYKRSPTSYSDVYAPFIAFDPDETLTVIEQGRLVRGVLDKAAVGAGSGSIFHLISRQYGSQRALDALFSIQQIALQFLMWRGFTVGPSDLLPGANALREIRALVTRTILESKVVTDRLVRGEIVPPIGSTVHEFYERIQIESALKIPESEVMRWILGSVRPDTNGFFRMIASGSKGSNPNLIQVKAAIGQTTIDGERIGEHFAFRRTLPYYARFSTDPAANGFVANGYMVGMRIDEFTCQDMNGRFDLINKALTTATTGYFMRKGVMNNQSSIVNNLRAVTKDTRVVQLIYAENGCDPRELEKVSFRMVALSDAGLRKAAWVDVAAITGDANAAAAQAAVDQAVAKIKEDRDVYRQTFLKLEASNFGSVFVTDQQMPVNVKGIVDGVFLSETVAARLAGEEVASRTPTAGGILARIELVWDLCTRLPYILLNEGMERQRRRVPAHLTAAASLLCMLVRAELCPQVVARLTDNQLAFIIDAIRERYQRSLIEYGTAAGTLAAQALSQPLTQYMLDSHHRSVGGGTNKSGLVRISEIYGAKDSSEELTSGMLLLLRREVLGSPEGALAAAQAIANGIEYVTMRRFVHRQDVLLESYGGLVYPDFIADSEWIREFEKSHPLIRPPSDLTNLCMRFVLDKSTLVLKAVELETVVQRLRRLHPDVYIVHTPETVPEIIIRVWHRSSQFKRAGLDEPGRVEEVNEEILETPIRGIKGILMATATRVPRHEIGPDGELIKVDRYAVSTHGTNLYSACLNSAVDSSAVVSTSISDTYKMFGIEAARSKIVSETKSFMEGRAPGAGHIYLYADEMCRTGRPTSIERNGLNAREPNNIFLKMAYGAPIQAATDATFSCARSKIYGIAAPQMMGSIPQIGTFYNGLVVNEAFVRENNKSVDDILNDL